MKRALTTKAINTPYDNKGNMECGLMPTGNYAKQEKEIICQKCELEVN
jgi:hypothetical protein